MADVLEFTSAAGSKPKIVSSYRNPSRLNSALKIGKYSGGISRNFFQFDTVDGSRLTNRATFDVPPIASIAVFADLSIHLFNSQNLKMQVVHDADIANSTNLNSVISVRNVREDDMAINRDEIIARLRQLPEVLGKTDGEIAETCGITAQQWSNYKSETNTESTIRPTAALELWNAYGIPMEWVYDSQTARTLDPEMRAKLTVANRKVAAWLTARKPRRRGNPSILATALAGAFLCACASDAGHAWKRIDGHPIETEGLQAARLACKGEAAKSVTGNLYAALQPETVGPNSQMWVVYEGCMAEHGYLEANKP